jgi:hypothetical protein
MTGDLWHQFLTNPWVLAYVAGIWTGWTAARRSTRYMLGGRP